MKTLFIGHELIEIQSVDSTNSYLNALMNKKKLAEGFIVWAKEQTAGRGQRGTQWESEPHQNITLSIALYPFFLHLERQFLLNKTIALAVADFVSYQLKPDDQQKVSIKWPNDVYVNNKKIAGILIENSVRNTQIGASIIGIGINVNQTEFRSIKANPTSLRNLTNNYFDLKNCIDTLCSFVEARYLQLKSLKFTTIDDDYEKALFRLNQQSSFIDPEGVPFYARIAGISKEGKLILENENGDKKEYGLKEISFVV